VQPRNAIRRQNEEAFYILKQVVHTVTSCIGKGDIWGTLSRWDVFFVSFTDVTAACIINNKFWEELIAYFPLIRHGPHRKQKIRDTHTAV
jgi:hypothetical protein